MGKSPQGYMVSPQKRHHGLNRGGHGRELSWRKFREVVVRQGHRAKCLNAGQLTSLVEDYAGLHSTSLRIAWESIVAQFRYD